MFQCVVRPSPPPPSHTCTRAHALTRTHTPARALPDLCSVFLTFLTSHDVESLYRLSTIRLFSSGVFFLEKALGYLFLPSLHSPKGRAAGGGGSVCPESRDRRNVDLVPAALAPLFLPPFPAPGSWACLTPVPASGSSPGNRASCAVTSPAWGLMGICASEMAFSGCCWPVGSQLILEFFFLI